MCNRERLPGLESVKSGGEIGALTLFVLAVAAFSAFGYFILRTLFCNSPILMTVLMVLFAGALVVVFLKVVRNPLFDFNWATTREGLKFSGCFRGGLIRWEDVIEINHRPHKRSVIRSRDQITYLPLSNLLFNASVWQHLNGCGKANGFKLSGEAESFWTPIPDGVPYEVSWMDPRPAKLWINLLPLLFIIIICLLAIYYNPYLSGLLYVLAIRPLWHWAKKPGATKISINSHGFQSNTIFRSVNMPWDSISSAECTIYKLTIESPSGALVIPRKDNEDLILAIVRRLRTLEKPLLVTLPKSYVAVWRYGSAEV